MAERRIVAFVPDLMDRSRLNGVDGIEFVPSVAALAEAKADVFVVDLARLDAFDLLARLEGRVIAFGSHVDRAVLDAARAAGCDEAMPRSQFFARARELLA